MKVCYFGIYNPNYSRNKILIRGLKENDIDVVECRINPKEPFKYWKLFKKYAKIKNYDLMIVGFPGHPIIPFAKLVCRKPIIFDALVSLYDSNVLDRKRTSPHSFNCLKYWLLDQFSCKLADKILLDTTEHIKYFVRTFGIKREKFERIFIGADDAVFYPRDLKKNTNKFLVLFWGTYIPLQGVEYVIQAAKKLELENIKFNLIGEGQTHQMAVNLCKKLNVKNIDFIKLLPQEELAKYIALADVCLGIFGETQKADRVIPNKVYEALACRKPIITRKSPAIRELLVDRENVLFCQKASGRDLAEKIVELKNDLKLRSKIADNGYKLFKEKLTSKLLGYQLKKIIENL